MENRTKMTIAALPTVEATPVGSEYVYVSQIWRRYMVKGRFWVERGEKRKLTHQDNVSHNVISKGNIPSNGDQYVNTGR